MLSKLARWYLKRTAGPKADHERCNFCDLIDEIKLRVMTDLRREIREADQCSARLGKENTKLKSDNDMLQKLNDKAFKDMMDYKDKYDECLKELINWRDFAGKRPKGAK